MQKDLKLVLSYSFIFIFCFLTTITKQFIVKENIPFCIEQIQAPSRFSQYLYDQDLCIRCVLGYVVSKNYKQCLEFRYELNYLQYGNCKRLQLDGFCGEALDGIELLPNRAFTIVQDQKFLERCAIVSESQSECIFPRFGFILDVKTGLLFKDTEMTFCALYDSKLDDCVQFQQMFIRFPNTKQGAYLGTSFLNPLMISFNSTSEKIICSGDFTYQQYIQLSKIEGCFQDIKIINHCKFQKYQNYCQQCERGYALRDDKAICSQTIPFCQVYMVIHNTNICIRCNKNYKLQNQNCIQLTNCKIVSRKNPNICIGCKRNYILLNGQCLDSELIQKRDGENILGIRDVDGNHDVLEDSEIQQRKYKENNKDNQEDKQPNKNDLPHQINKEDGERILQPQQNKYSQLKNDKINQNFIETQEIDLSLDSNLRKKLDQKQPLKEGNQLIQLLKKKFRNIQEFFQTNENCLAYNDKQCLACQSPQMFYFDENINECVQRIRSKDCLYPVLNRDACQNFKCKVGNFIDKIFLEQFDIKVKQIINYLIHIEDKFFGSDNMMNELEVEELRNHQLSLGINTKITSNLCHPSAKFGGQCIEFGYQCECKKNLFPSLNLTQTNYYLTINCVDRLQMKNIQIERCLQYDLEKSFCFECKKGYYFNSKSMICEQNIPNCLIHTLQNTCFLCQSGYQLVNNTFCQPICGPYPYTSKTEALRLYNSWMIKNDNESDQQKMDCIAQVKPCYKFKKDRCIECFEGYVLDQSKDFICIRDAYFPDCKVIDQIEQILEAKSLRKGYSHENKECISCQKDYQLIDGLCFCQKQKCMNYIFCNGKQCFKKHFSIFSGFLNLPDNYYLEKFGKIYKAFECKIKNCNKCVEGNICQTCQYGYYYDSQEQMCIYLGDQQFIVDGQLNQPIESACEEYLKKECKKCKKGYFLMQDQQCYKKCKKNDIIYPTSINGDLCLTCPIGCQECNFDLLSFIYPKQIACSLCHKDYFQYEDQTCKATCNFIKVNNGFTKKCTRYCKNLHMFQHEGQCVEKCPHNFYLIEKGDLICLESCDGFLRNEENKQLCQKYCEEGYYQEGQTCKKCKALNCKICSSENPEICLVCLSQSGFSIQNLDGICKIICQGNHLADKIEECRKYVECQNAAESYCQNCPKTFIYNKQKSECQCPNNTALYLELFICIQICGDKLQQFDPKFPQKCQKCQPRSFKLQDNSLAFCLDKCPNGYYEDLKSQSCQKCPQSCFSCENENNCTLCQPFYTKVYYDEINKKANCICKDKKCEKQCESLDIFQIQFECCFVRNCQLCSKNKHLCEKCFHYSPYLFLNTCLLNCPEGTFADLQNNCIPCDRFCKTCIGKSSNCTSCVLNQKFAEDDETCKCKNQKLFYSKQCFSFCPRFTKSVQAQGYCEEYCPQNNSFPVFDENGEFERCESDFSSNNSKFCEQSLINIDKFIIFSIKDENQQVHFQDKAFTLIIQVNSTPKECYNFQLKTNLSDNQSNLTLKLKDLKIIDKFNFNFRLESIINIQEFYQNNQKLCKKNVCYLFFQIFLQNQLRLTIQFQVDFNSIFTKIQSISQHSQETLDYQKQFVEKISQDEILNSQLLVECQGLKTCNSSLIIVHTFKNVAFSLKNEQANNGDQQLIIQPISVYIQKEDQTLIPIHNFFYENFYPSQLSMTIQFEKVTQGKIFLLFKTNNWRYRYQGQEYFNKRCKSCRYILKNVDINVMDEINYQDFYYQKNQKNQSEEYYVFFEVILFINIFICLVILSKFIIKCLQEHQIKKLNYQQHIDDQESKNFNKSVDQKERKEDINMQDIFAEQI